MAVIALLASLGLGRTVGARPPASALAAGEDRLAPYFARAGVPYPPSTVALLALKDEARLEVWADGGRGWQFVRSYLVRASSGRLGPKLRAGDHQVPEGVYRVAALNPDSRYHLSMRIDYPNAFDRARADEDGRAQLGGNIMIHGSAVSDGCLPVGDTAVEELFALTERVGPPNVTVIVSPVDLRRVDASVAAARAAQRPSWLRGLYATIARALQEFPLPEDDAPLVRPSHTAAATPRCRAYDEADCIKRCGTGDLASCARAGLMRERERRVGAKAAETWAWLQKACAGGDALGCAELSQLYVGDDGPRRNATIAADLAQVACDGGDGHGCIYLANLCTERILYPGARNQCDPESVRRLYERAVALLQKDCSGWGAYDCYGLATIYSRGDPHTALRFAAGACQAGDPGGCDGLGRLSESDGDPTRARAVTAFR